MKRKEKVEPSAGYKKKRKLVLTKNVGPSPPPKWQSTIDESLKKPIKVKSIFSIKIVEPKNVDKEESGLIKRQRGRQVSRCALSEGKAQNFLEGRSNEIVPKVIRMLPNKVKSATRVYYKYWTYKYSSYVETYDSIDMLEVGIVL